MLWLNTTNTATKCLCDSAHLDEPSISFELFPYLPLRANLVLFQLNPCNRHSHSSKNAPGIQSDLGNEGGRVCTIQPHITKVETTLPFYFVPNLQPCFHFKNSPRMHPCKWRHHTRCGWTATQREDNICAEACWESGKHGSAGTEVSLPSISDQTAGWFLEWEPGCRP